VTPRDYPVRYYTLAPQRGANSAEINVTIAMGLSITSHSMEAVTNPNPLPMLIEAPGLLKANMLIHLLGQSVFNFEYD
jgi:hypothetical protein